MFFYLRIDDVYETDIKHRLGPVMVILASQALSVEPTRDTSLCPGVKTLNFSQESLEEWRQPTKIDGMAGETVSYWNETISNVSDPIFFDYWDSPQNFIKDHAQAVATLKRDVYMPDSSQKTCGPGWDCQYNITFTAPGYKCEEIFTGSSNQSKTSRGAVPPFNESVLIPHGNFSYFTYASGGEYSSIQMDMDHLGLGGHIRTQPPFPKDLGTFRTEPVI